MNQEQLKKKIEYSLQEGFTEKEIRQVLKEQGIRRSEIEKAFNQIRTGNNGQEMQQEKPRNGTGKQGAGNGQQRGRSNGRGPGNQKPRDQMQQNRTQQTQNYQNREIDSAENNGSNSPDRVPDHQQERGKGTVGAIPGLDLTDSFYRVKQSFLLKRYTIYDQDGEQVLEAKNKIFSLKTRIPFQVPEKEGHIFKVESERLLNISNNYNLTQENGGDLAVIDRKRTIFNQVWRVRDPNDNSIAAKIKTASQAVMAVRIIGSRIPFLGVLTSIIPHTYEIEDNNGQKIGELEGQLSIRDTYDLKLHDSGSLNREAMIAAVISIDAIEGQ